jgi:hypothetical protein
MHRKSPADQHPAQQQASNHDEGFLLTVEAARPNPRLGFGSRHAKEARRRSGKL